MNQPGRPPLEPRITALELELDALTQAFRALERKFNGDLESRLQSYDEAFARGAFPKPPIRRLDI